MIGGIERSVADIEYMYPDLFKLWVPILYKGKFDEAKFIELSKGMEQVSGKETNVREGIVVSPVIPRNAKKGWPLFVKIINPAYCKKETGEEFS